MKISSYSKAQSFGSNYKFNITKANYDKASEALDTFYNLEMQDGNNCEIIDNHASFAELSKTGIIERVSIHADDKYDEFIESALKQKNVEFQKITRKEALNFENIFNRIVLSGDYPNDFLISLDTQKFDELFKKNAAFYISENGESGAISNRYQRFKKYLETGENINATKIYLSEKSGQLTLSIQDGRHRYSVMRDMGMDKIKFAMDLDSLNLAFKYGLVRK